MSKPYSVVVLISGNGSNLQAIMDHVIDNKLPIQLSAVISNRPNAYGLQRAQAKQIQTEVLDHKGYASREDFDLALQQCIDQYQPDLIVLAGFMRILSPSFVQHYANRLINIHPSLLPDYQGLNTHARVIEAGEKEHGTTVHFVTEDLDDGPPMIQARVPINPEDTPETLQARVQQQEYLIYPLAVEWLAAKRLVIKDRQVFFDGQLLSNQGYQFQMEQKEVVL